VFLISGVKLIGKIKAASESKRRRPTFPVAKAGTPERKTVLATPKNAATIVALGTSTGGPKALQEMLPLLPEDGKAAAHYVYMRRVHSRDKRPYCVISIYPDEKIFRKSPKRFRKETVIPILKDMREPAISSARRR
jgi:hypothetical protein